MRMSQGIKNYLLITKPGILLANLISAAAGFFLASRGRVDGALLLSTLLGIGLVVASGCVSNNCVDRQLDRTMVRTRNRALARGQISLRAAVCYAAVLGMAGLTLLWAATNPLTVAIVLAGLVIYVGVYSLYLKRHSLHGPLLGSLAGAAPPLAGYCAVSHQLDPGALILFTIFSLWQMPHCYAIVIFRLDDYTAAAIPVVPVELGMAAAKRHILAYMLAFVAATLMLTVGGYTGYSYFAVAAVLGLAWLHLARSGYKSADDRLWAKKLYAFSILTIFALSVMMSIDCTGPAASGTPPSPASSSTLFEPGRP